MRFMVSGVAGGVLFALAALFCSGDNWLSRVPVDMFTHDPELTGVLVISYTAVCAVVRVNITSGSRELGRLR